MYLKSIDIQGFKSFANKIVFEFKDGITAIVGPNGSGKSNVADAVRWVLGEQSAKQLRGGSMQDVIFSGTQTRKPLGFASVAITFDNTDRRLPIDFEEVTVMRRVYRSGESEYMLNGHNCRLRDVQDLFLDTGIGKEGYSIIGQGQIDRILSGKPEDRRELFDEAAGIVKYKKRKQMAEKDLDTERVNLSRVSDILYELEKQSGPLEQQAATAREYLKLKERLKRLEVNQFLMDHKKNRLERQSAEERLEIVTADLLQTRQVYDSTKEEYTRLELELEEKNKLLEEKNKIKQDLLLEIERTDGDNKLLHGQIAAIEESDVHFQERYVVVEKEIKEKQQEFDGCKNNKKGMEERLDALDEAQANAVEQSEKIRQEIEAATLEMERCNEEIFRLIGDNSTIKADLLKFQTLGEQNNIKKAELNQKVIRNKSEEATYQGRLAEQRKEYQSIEDEINKNRTVITDLEQTLSEELKENEENTQLYAERQQEYLTAEAKRESLTNLTERYEGYGGSIKRVMEQKQVMPGIIGVVADIIKVQKNYETAIETALGGAIQNIVTDNETTAKELIDYLKRNKFGRATFLPLTSITGSRLGKEEALKENGVIGLASSLVDTNEQFQALTEFLLGRIIVVDHIDHALALARKYKYSLRLVTLDGEQLNPGGSLSGGAFKNSGNLLGRRREIEELNHSTEMLKKECDTRKEQIARQKEQCLFLRSELEQKKEELRQQLVLQNTAKLKVTQEEERISTVRSAFQEFAAELRELEGQTGSIKEEQGKLNATADANRQTEAEKKLWLEACNIRLAEWRQKEKESAEQISALRAEMAGLEQSSRYVVENTERLQEEIRRFIAEKETLERTSAEGEQKKEERRRQIALGEEKKKEYRTLLTECTSVLEECSRQREQISLQHKAFFGKRDELSSRITELDKDAFRLQNQQERLKEQMDAQISYLWEEYELTPTSAEELFEEEFTNPVQNKKEISEQKIKIKELGEVNVNAIEDFRALSERFTFLKTQHEDLKNSEQTLLAIIVELEEEMRKQFEEKFIQIKERFDYVFRELFGGGKGTLELTEDEDLLEAGIRIIAQPPGKKLQNMMQLSGGEKALTAISLLFAIQSLKPSPFCLLDEIEAALDDSNVKRYADYLHKLTKDTQFIVITHRRGTMATADILYGITMQEKGVSALVSVSLIEEELDKSR